MTKITPRDGNIIVIPEDEAVETTTESGLVIEVSSNSDTAGIGRVKSISEDCGVKDLKEGSRIVYSKEDSYTVTVGGIICVIMGKYEVLAILTE